MRKILIIYTITFVLCMALSGCNRKPPEKKIPRVAIVSISHNFDRYVQGFQDGLATLGYRAGETITYLYDGPIEKAELAARLTFLKTQNIDLLCTATTPVTRKAKEVFRDTPVPILFAPVFSPVDAGLVDSISQPGGNITGVMARGSTAKALGYLLDILPAIKTIFVPFHRRDMAAQFTVQDLKQAAAIFDIEIITPELDNVAELNEVLQAIPAVADALWLTHSHLIVSNTAMIVEAAMQHNIPVASSSLQVKNGVLVSYGVESSSMGRQAGRLADKLLQGIPAARLPIERAEYVLALNLDSAQKMGITIPRQMLRQADIVLRPD